MNMKRATAAGVAAARGLALALMGWVASVALLVLTLVSLALLLLGIGVFTTPILLRLVRAHALARRRLAAEWADIPIPIAYPRLPDDPRGGIAGQVELCVQLLRSRSTWRDLQWLLVDITAAPFVAVLVPGLLAQGIFGLLLNTGLWRPIARAEGGTYWFTFVPVSGTGTAALAGLVGLVQLVTVYLAGPALIRTHFRITAALLRPSRESELVERIGRLTETRHDALDTSAAELRRIERDLHDGAQARLVAVGMNLGVVEALIEKDPAQAKALIAMARESSAEALTELRDLVRGIHPPVLAERGLGDAVKALALRLPVGCEVSVELPGRADAPVESAAYFAVSEALTNAVRHGGAERIWVDISHAGGALRIAVTDNGRGGAVIGPVRADGSGTGLSGVERRLGTFDGVLAVSSPAGGPTMVTMEIPCVLS
ncbi:histidine kinase [Streptomyces sp. NPDC000594]|uniref:sensor histidine kinase n=1 Tax=Streptomyces sp. NPDC000594 TaxID=3154261 RepID=UPI003316A607